ncbi:MAG: 3-hydroxyacyl-CoA dehydrogenase family protein [Pseudomonadota bacterium]
MNYQERLEEVAVLGAAGKMGSGIVLLTAMEMVDLGLESGRSSAGFALHALDVSQQALSGLMSYLRPQIRKAAEKKTVSLRKAYERREDLIENEEVIGQYVEDVLAVVRPTTLLEAAYNARVVFEAVGENPDLKVQLLSRIREHNSNDPWFLTNTSSIPIAELNDKAKLRGRILGFHFYNPPAVQKLAELICAESTVLELQEFARTFAEKLKKTIVPSRDVAGFIGNGHFMRDALHGIAEAERLSKEVSITEALYMVNKITQDFLIRPMGIFQLVDYVGLDVCQCILKVMNGRLRGASLHNPLLDQWISMGIRGGQNPDGSQKDGILKYEKGRPSGVWEPTKKAYVALSEIAGRCDEKLGSPPSATQPWKQVIGRSDRAAYLEGYFRQLKEMSTPGAELARKYGQRSKTIGLELVKDGVAARDEDVNTVLLTGFYHSYGPINAYFD